MSVSDMQNCMRCDDRFEYDPERWFDEWCEVCAEAKARTACPECGQPVEKPST